MPSDRRTRRRAVRLTEEGLRELEAALARKVSTEGPSGRLTREARAKTIGVYLSTANKIFAREGVDRGSLIAAFEALGAEWREAYCEAAQEALADENLPSSRASSVDREGEGQGEGGGGSEIGEVTPPEAISNEPSSAETLPADHSLESGSIASEALTSRPAKFEAESASINDSLSEWRPPRLVWVALGLALIAVLAYGTLTRHDDPQAEALAHFDQVFESGMAAYHHADYALAQRYSDEAIEMADEMDSVGRITGAYRLRADVRSARGEIDAACSDLREALTFTRTAAARGLKYTLEEELGELELVRGNIAEARQLFEDSQEGCRTLGSNFGVALAYRGLGSVNAAEGHLDAADQCFESCIASVDPEKQIDLITDVRQREALVLLKRGRPIEARQLLMKCLDHWVKSGHARWIAKSRLLLAEAEVANGQPARARPLLELSLLSYSRLGDRLGEAKADRALYELNRRFPAPAFPQ